MPDSTSDTLDTETTSWTDSVSACGMNTLQSVEDGIGTVGRGIWEFFHEFPLLGATIGGGLGLGAVALIGVAELATALITAYVGYRVFAYGESLTEALEKSIQLKEGKLLDEEINE